MSKRLNKRQQREAEELPGLKAQHACVAEVEEGKKAGEDDIEETVVNPFDALEENEEEDEEVSDQAPETAVSTLKKAKKKKPKKKQPPSAVTPAMEDDTSNLPSLSTMTPSHSSKDRKKGHEDPIEGMDEIDRALVELKLKYGEGSTVSEVGPSNAATRTSESRHFTTFRNLLSIDPKNLDADAELRRFFGSKVIASSAQAGPNRHRPAASSKLRYTISKPKPTYPPATSLAGLSMRELSEEEVDQAYARKGLVSLSQGEKWFTFEHSGAWREVERQFMGAVRSHDPNELMALLQVYPWHVDTLLQMSEVYRLQSDIGAASDFAERALYAFDRCLMPAFSVSSGSSRLDFDRVENRPMFTALHRIISYLGRRGCWVTAFNFAKLLFALDPLGDPHGSAFWLDFLAIKSNNGDWLLSMLKQSESEPAAADFLAYPGMAYAKALALRQQEHTEKSADQARSDAALQSAICTFPQVVNLLADKIGASLPSQARSHPLLQIQAGYSDSNEQVFHLLSHIYVSRSEALWKEASTLAWFEAQVAATLPNLDSSQAKSFRSAAISTVHEPRDPIDESLNVALFICRHVLCSESTSWLGMLPPPITSRPFHAYDPLPPSTAISQYDAGYFNGSRPSGRSTARGGGVLERFIDRVRGLAGDDPARSQATIRAAWDHVVAGGDFQGIPEGEMEDVLQQILRMAAAGQDGQMGGQGGGGMPGGFPGIEGGSETEGE